MRQLYREALPASLARTRRRAEAILRGEHVIFGRPAGTLGWHQDARGLLHFDPATPAGRFPLVEPGPDPRGAWERARGSFWTELGVAVRLEPDLRTPAAERLAGEIHSFLDENPLGLGVHWTSPLEAALRALHWLAAIDLIGREEVLALLGRRFAGTLVEHGRFIVDNLERHGVVPANHLLANAVGLLAIGLAVGQADDAAEWRRESLRLIAGEAQRQVLRDGSFFEGSTSYHRFALELLLAGQRLAERAVLGLDLGKTLGRMFRFVAGTLGPDGTEPAYGDGDDGRVWPMAERRPREHGYLLPVGVVLLGDPWLRRAGVGFSEEAAWLAGRDGYRRWQAMPESRPAPWSSYREGGIHVLRGGDDQLEMRCGGHGQRGVGGHSHNDQLSLVVWLDGQPLVIDPGTYCYASDPSWRDYFRGTACHSTLLVDGVEQSALLDERMFALPDQARGRCRELEDDVARARLVGTHRGFTRLGCRALVRRSVELDRRLRSIIVEDHVQGRGQAAVESRFCLGDLEVLLPSPCELPSAITRHLGTVLGERWRGSAPALAMRGGLPWAALVALDDSPPLERLAGWWSPGYGERRPASIVRLRRRVRLPATFVVGMVPLSPGVAT